MSTSSVDSTPLSLDQIRETLDVAWNCRRSDPHKTVLLSRRVLAQPLEDAELARATLCLGGGLLYQGEFNAAEPELQRALHLYNGMADQAGQRDTLNSLGIVRTRQCRPAEALDLLSQSRHLSVILGNVQGEADVLLNIGVVYSSVSDHPNAVHHHLLGLGLARKHDLPVLERRALNNLSVSYNDMGRHEDALEAATACLKIEAEDDSIRPLALRNAGYAHFKLGQFPEAQAMYLKASELLKDGNQVDIADLDLLLGRVAQQQGNLDEARHLFDRSLTICQKIGDEQGQVEGLLRLGILLGLTGELEEALSSLHRARTLAEQGQFCGELCEVHLTLSRLYRDSGHYHEALTHLGQHLQLKGELFSTESDQRLQSLRVQFELEQTERERLATQRRNEELSDLNARLQETNRDLQTAQAQTADLMARLEQYANEDALTGLPNRRAFNAALAGLSPTQQVSVVLCDIDHFKSVNDRFSHLVGDEVLRQVAALLRGRVRQGDLLARYGGEEFVLLLTGASEAATLELCEDLRRTIESYDWSTVRPEFRLTMSVGAAIAHLNPAALTAQDVVQAADDALYAAKDGGRNRVEISSKKLT
ncbi:tetratricopeptide repeat-containing diguanylate cyclase [Deinococcus marmoris]|uniref:GGDEF domain protein n=1 Tax=Deinococcus marmoris TaxID=249408 RepID=A0A1U7NTZ0_9DEIO|nr:tetratricopeptide repeat-containing diguanylate cyclase [Deinococcus marmoris]OLV16393.1 GGDEF domain protein [Deinococcus marmoris]